MPDCRKHLSRIIQNQISVLLLLIIIWTLYLCNVWNLWLSQSVDEGADGFAVGVEGEDGEGMFVVLRVGAVAVGGFEEVDLRGAEVEGLGNAGYLRGGKRLFIVE